MLIPFIKIHRQKMARIAPHHWAYTDDLLARQVVIDHLVCDWFPGLVGALAAFDCGLVANTWLPFIVTGG